MKLSPDLLRACSTGCAELREEPEGLFFDRMAPALRAHFGSSEAAVIRARCQAGIRIRFASTTQNLRIAMRFNRAARPFDTVDLHVEGEPWGSFVGERTPEPWSACLFIDPRPIRRSFDLFLPHCVESWLVSLAVDDTAVVEPLPPEPLTWLVIGDSISQGMTCASPSRTYTALAARTLGCNHHNTAVGGAKMDPGAAEAAAIPADFATVAFGCNDWNGCKRLAQYEADSIAFLDRFFALRPGMPLGLVTAFPAVGPAGEKNKDGVMLESYREVLRHLAPRYPAARIIEGGMLVPADPRFFTDGIHPNTPGMAVIAKNMVSALRALLPHRT